MRLSSTVVPVITGTHALTPPRSRRRSIQYIGNTYIGPYECVFQATDERGATAEATLILDVQDCAPPEEGQMPDPEPEEPSWSDDGHSEPEPAPKPAPEP